MVKVMSAKKYRGDYQPSITGVVATSVPAARIKNATAWPRQLLTGAMCGDFILYALFRGNIPHRDFVVAWSGVILIMLLTSFESKDWPMSVRAERFRTIFNTLSSLEVVFTILIPWLAILEGLPNKNLTTRNGRLLAPHLFIFQAQIAGECMIMLYGERRKWLMFPFTCVANAYRGVVLGTWVFRMLSEEVVGYRDIILPIIATGLWIYSTFVFIPKVWYPLIKDERGKS